MQRGGRELVFEETDWFSNEKIDLVSHDGKESLRIQSGAFVYC